MRKFYKIAASVLSLMILSASIAQSQQIKDVDSENIEYIVVKVPDGLYGEPKHTNYFFKTKKGNLVVAAGANIRVVNTFDMAGIVENSMNGGFVVPYIPSSMNGKAKGQYYLSPATSQIYVKGVGKLNNGHTIQGYLSINFMGANYSPELYQAYVKLYNFTVGKAWNTMANVNAAPPTIDYWGPSGFGGFRNAIIRYENWISNRFSYGISVEMPIVDAKYGVTNHSLTQCMPDATGYIQYNWGQDNESTARLSGVYRYMTYFDDVNDKSRADNGFGIQLSGSAYVTPKMIAFYRAIGGYGIASYINDIGVAPVDLVQKSTSLGQMTNLGMYGAYLGLQYNITDEIFVSALYSQARIYSREGGIPTPNEFKYSQYILGNCFWNVSKNLQLAVEYLHGIKTDFDSRHSSANRMNLLLQYSF